jgi:disulfide bond formation protein DsbB
MSRPLGEIRFDAPGREARLRPARSSPARRVDACLALIVGSCLFAVGAALVSQYRFGMDPCPWCILQRVIFLAIALAAILGLLWRRATGRMIAALLALVLALSGVATALWQHFVAASSTSCGLSFADRLLNAAHLPTLLPAVFQPLATCADAAVNLLGVPYALWGFAAFAFVGIVALAALGSARRA